MVRHSLAQLVAVLLALLHVAMVALPTADTACMPISVSEACPCCTDGCCCTDETDRSESASCPSCRAATPIISQGVRPVMPDLHDTLVVAVLPAVSEMPLPQASPLQARSKPPDPGPSRRARGTDSTVLLL